MARIATSWAMLAEWNRSGTWTIVKGKGQLLINDETRTIKEGESVVINKEDKYSIKAIEELHIIEVQIGDELVEKDIERFKKKQTINKEIIN